MRLLFAILLTFVVFCMGCAEERPAIDRVQAGAIAKAFFVGPI